LGYRSFSWRHHGIRHQSWLFIPLSVIGLPTDTLLKADKSEVAISDHHGARLYAGTGEDVEIRNDAAKESLSYQQTIQVPHLEMETVCPTGWESVAIEWEW
jgi:hypothetical protein